jgi:hypothetical protein
MRLFIRTGGDAGTGEAALIRVLAGDILPSVSRRDPRRGHADLWTSGNRVFQTDNPQVLLDAAISCAAEAMGSGLQPRLWGTFREREAVERVAVQLRDLAALEAVEEAGAPLAVERSVGWKLSSTMSWSGSTATPSG